MVKRSDTRALVAQAAQHLFEQGREPTVTLVREALGGGSPNVIVEELRKWREARVSATETQGLEPLLPPLPSPAPAQTSSPLGEQSALELALLVRATRELVKEQTDHRAELSAERAEMRLAATQVAEGLAQLSKLMAVLETERATTSGILERMEARYEGIRKHMLLAIEESREEARQWRERARTAQGELEVWKDTLQRRIEALLTENGELRGRLQPSSLPAIPHSSVRPGASLPSASARQVGSPPDAADYSE